MSGERLLVDSVHIVTDVIQQDCKPNGEILVQLDLHRISGTAGKGKSSSADAAANAIAAWTSSSFRLGKSARISSGRSPSARLARTVRRVTRVPLNTGSPAQILGSRVILLE